MSYVFWCWPSWLANGVGFHKPTVGRFSASSPGASSPGLDQGGMVETLMEGIWKSVEMASGPFTPQSRSDVVGSLRLRLQGPDHRRPDVVLQNNIGPSGTRRSRSCPRHSLRPSLGDGGRLTPTPWGARLSSLTSFLRAPKVGGCAAIHLTSEPDVAGRAQRPTWEASEPLEVASV